MSQTVGRYSIGFVDNHTKCYIHGVGWQATNGKSPNLSA